MTTVCGLLKQVIGGKTMSNAPSLTTQLRTLKSQARQSLWLSGNLYMIVSPVNEECSAETQVNVKLLDLDDVIRTGTSGQILVRKSSSDRTNSAICPKLLYDMMTMRTLFA